MPDKVKRQRVEGMLYRSFEIRADGIVDEENRVITASISSEVPVPRSSWFSDPWLEILGHKRGEPKLERLNSGAPVLYNHQRTRSDRIGVVESAKLVDRKIECQLRFSKREDINDIWQDIADGVLRNISVGYVINERTLTREVKGEPSEYRVTSWTPMEVSAVDIPADSEVGIGREFHDENFCHRIFDIVDREGDAMKFDNDGNPIAETDEDRAAIAAGTASRKDGTPYKLPAAIVVTEPVAAQPTRASVTELDTARAEGAEDERTRCQEIGALFEPFGNTHDAVRAAAIKDKKSVDQTRQLLLKAIGEGVEPVGGDAIRIVGGVTDVQKFTRGASLSIQLRANIDLSDADRQEATTAGLRSYTLLEFARKMLEFNHVDTLRMDKMTLVGRAFTTSDFPEILRDAANVSMLKGWDESPETWAVWAAVGNLSDFKISHRVNLSSFSDLTQVNEDGEYTYGVFKDEGQTIQLATFGKLFAISRQSIINDDLSAFTRIPRAMGRASSRVVGDLAYGVLTANELLSDGLALFSGTTIGTDHGNLNIGGAAVITATSFAQARQAMARQTDTNKQATGLNIRPKYLITPLSIEDVARVLMASEFDPADGTNNNRAPNPVRGQAQVVTDPRLDTDSATKWYVAADQAIGDTVEVAFLDGNQTPMLEQQAGWTIDGTEFKVRLDVAAAAMDFRGLQTNDGV